MEAAHQARIAFFLTGKRPVELDPVGAGELTPALLAPYRDLAALRHDYPVVLLPDAAPERCLRPLSALVDEALVELAAEVGGERVSGPLLRLETGLRRVLAAGERGSLAQLLESAARWPGAGDDRPEAEALAPSLARALAVLPGDAAVLDCDAALPGALLEHVWRSVETRRARRLADRLERLTLESSNILRAEEARSETGRSPAALRAALGGADAEAFDFDALSRVLARSAGVSTLSEARRERLEALVAALGSYGFDPDACCFERCSEALDAWRERYPAWINLARAIAVAELEIDGEYREDRHDHFFEDYGADGLTPDELAALPAFLVCVNAETMDAGEQSALMEILAEGLPMKILVQSDDILEDTRPPAATRGFSRSAPHFANMAVGLNDVFVLQVAASHLPRRLERIAEGMAFPGGSLFSVYSGATSTLALPPYLAAAAAVEARAFPVFIHAPGAGHDLAPRLDLEGNPSPDADWSTSVFEHEDEQRRRCDLQVPFTFVDFAALDARFVRHLAWLAPGSPDDETIAVDAALERAPGETPDRLPAILMVDREDRLHHVLIDERLLRAGRRCLDGWHGLQARAHQTAEPPTRSQEAQAASTNEIGASASGRGETRPRIAATVVLESAEAASDDAYIETPRCTTCNECTQINDRMFAYNEDRQAYIADPEAGTYADLVEAAESCQVSIIHPGEPRNPGEPGLEALRERAEPFL